VARPTILTGANDGGKTSLLLALEFLLTGKAVSSEDFTSARPDELPSISLVDGRYSECWVEGRFRPDQEEQELTGFGDGVLLRRRQEIGESPSLQIRTIAPSDERLRALDDRKLEELRTIATELAVEPVGPKNQKASYVVALKSLAEAQPQVPVWVPVSPELVDRLPRLISFASTAEPDPEADIRQALQEAYARTLEDAEIVGPVREAERQVREKLGSEANELRNHIIAQCPELSNLVVEPSVSFKEGFGRVRLMSTRGQGSPVSLSGSGTGTRRRITLATWEWTRGLLSRGESPGRNTILAYDEPDTHLDYGHQRDLVDLIRRQCEVVGVRVIVATHSMNLIDKVSIQDVVHLELSNERTVVKRLFTAEHGEVDRHLTNVAASMGLRNSVLLHERCFVGVEGVTEQQAIPLLFGTATGLSLQAAGIALVPAGGNAGALAFCRYLIDQGREVLFIVDRDSAAHRKFSPDKLKGLGVRDDQMFLVGNPDEIEDLFTDEQWAEVANAEWPREDSDSWVPSQFSALRQSGKFSSQLHELIKQWAAEWPTSKASLLPALAERLRAKDDVPKELAEIFGELIRITSQR
jgi:ABC-type dipeptide/oligopeptide/nickel transport system ATPase subunit